MVFPSEKRDAVIIEYSRVRLTCYIQASDLFLGSAETMKLQWMMIMRRIKNTKTAVVLKALG